MSPFLAGAGRVLTMWLIFGYLAWQLRAAGASEGVAVILSGMIAYGINRAWRAQQRERLLREHREQVEADEELRQAVRERRRQG